MGILLGEEYEHLKKAYLLKRSREFYDSALERMGKGLYSLSIFSLEQSLQHYLKAKLMEFGLDYLKTYSLRELITMLSEASNEPMLRRLVGRFSSELKTLEDVYAIYRLSKYTPREFGEEEVRRLKEAVDEVMNYIERTISGSG